MKFFALVLVAGPQPGTGGIVVVNQSAPTSAWLVVVAAGVGAAAGLLGQLVAHRLSSGREGRIERRDAYVEFLAACDRGMRVAYEVRQVAGRAEDGSAKRDVVVAQQADIERTLAGAETGGLADHAGLKEISKQRAQIKAQIKELGAHLKETKAVLKRLRNEMDAFLLAMDLGLGRMQLSASHELVGPGWRLREGVDEYADGAITVQDLDQRRRVFAARARVDLQGAPGVPRWLARRWVRDADRKERPRRTTRTAGMCRRDGLPVRNRFGMRSRHDGTARQ